MCSSGGLIACCRCCPARCRRLCSTGVGVRSSFNSIPGLQPRPRVSAALACGQCDGTAQNGNRCLHSAAAPTSAALMVGHAHDGNCHAGECSLTCIEDAQMKQLSWLQACSTEL